MARYLTAGCGVSAERLARRRHHRLLVIFACATTLLATAGGCVRRELLLGSECADGLSSCVPRDATLVGVQADAAVFEAMDASVDAPCTGCEAGPSSDAAVPKSRCVPGQYAGRFEVPEYRPVAAGLCGLLTIYGGAGAGAWEFAIPADSEIAADSMQIDTCLEFDLEPQPGSRDAGAVATTQLRTAFTATLDCTTGELSGEIRGAYYSQGLCTLGVGESWYSVKGFVDARFDPAVEGFVQGRVDLREPASLLPADQQLNPPTGGEGTWTAQRVDGPSLSMTTGCLDGVEFTDFEVQR